MNEPKSKRNKKVFFFYKMKKLVSQSSLFIGNYKRIGLDKFKIKSYILLFLSCFKFFLIKTIDSFVAFFSLFEYLKTSKWKNN